MSFCIFTESRNAHSQKFCVSPIRTKVEFRLAWVFISSFKVSKNVFALLSLSKPKSLKNIKVAYLVGIYKK